MRPVWMGMALSSADLGWDVEDRDLPWWWMWPATALLG